LSHPELKPPSAEAKLTFQPDIPYWAVPQAPTPGDDHGTDWELVLSFTDVCDMADHSG
jgi:hypothetical protein